MNPYELINKYYHQSPEAHHVLIEHGAAVSKKAIEIAKRLDRYKPDIVFVEEAAMLHDIGIIFTDALQIGCKGSQPYIRHGILGRELLEREGFLRHALVCERHVGLGITADDIVAQKLPLPVRDMTPRSIEEIIICFADKFFSKRHGLFCICKTFEAVRAEALRHGTQQLETFEKWRD